jgi:SlyX protein
MAEPQDAVDERIDDLEMRVAYQDEVIETLNKTVIEQWAKLDQALARIRRLEARLQEINISTIRDAADETPPPHY